MNFRKTLSMFLIMVLMCLATGCRQFVESTHEITTEEMVDDEKFEVSVDKTAETSSETNPSTVETNSPPSTMKLATEYYICNQEGGGYPIWSGGKSDSSREVIGELKRDEKFLIIGSILDDPNDYYIYSEEGIGYIENLQTYTKVEQEIPVFVSTVSSPYLETNSLYEYKVSYNDYFTMYYGEDICQNGKIKIILPQTAGTYQVSSFISENSSEFWNLEITVQNGSVTYVTETIY